MDSYEEEQPINRDGVIAADCSSLYPLSSNPRRKSRGSTWKSSRPRPRLIASWIFTVLAVFFIDQVTLVWSSSSQHHRDNPASHPDHHLFRSGMISLMFWLDLMICKAVAEEGVWWAV